MAGRRSLRLGPIRGHFWMMSFWPLARRWPGCWSWLWSSRGQESPSFSSICLTIKLWQVTGGFVHHSFLFSFESLFRLLLHFKWKIQQCSFHCDYNVFVMCYYTLWHFPSIHLHPFIRTSLTHPCFIQTFLNKAFLKQTSKVDALSRRSSFSTTSVCQVRGRAASFQHVLITIVCAHMARPVLPCTWHMDVWKMTHCF